MKIRHYLLIIACLHLSESSLPREIMDWITAISMTGNEKEMQKLLDHGFNINQQNSGGNTPLHYACGWGLKDSERQAKKFNIPFNNHLKEHASFVEFLLAHGANPNIQNNYGGTPLSSAIYHGRAATIKHLLDKGARINTLDQYGTTPLKRAIYFCYQDIIQLLLEFGSDVTEANRQITQEIFLKTCTIVHSQK
ncbi:MAG: ankyrin repeat domain-containing protein [Thiotrichaceae bacterium]|nr:ankyrin repeat domain-containing protein [Thiotrichaceae bacterium]